MLSSNSPCAACKCRRQKCTQDCVFAPYFPPDQTQKFIMVSHVFGASNIGKLLSKLDAAQREEAVNSLAYEAEYRIQDPIYGCVGLISNLQNKLKQVRLDLNNAKRELASYVGPSTFLPLSQEANTNTDDNDNHPSASGVMLYSNKMQQQMPVMGWLPTDATAPHGASLTISEPQQQQPQVFQAAAQY